MYAGHSELRDSARRRSPCSVRSERDELHRLSLPFVHCEFAHAMGTGPGGLEEYWDLYETYPRLAGGFVWEWIEHGDPGAR